MILNYLKIAWRNLLRNKTYSLINITGLALGLAACLAIGLYVVDEVSFDRFFESADRIYRIDANLKFGGPEQKLAVVSDQMAFTLKKVAPYRSYVFLHPTDETYIPVHHLLERLFAQKHPVKDQDIVFLETCLPDHLARRPSLT